MKIIKLFVLSLGFPCLLHAGQLKALPAYIPTAPERDKPIATYTVADVMGCAFTELPADHNYCKDKLYSAGLRANWPEAKVATSMDQMIQFVLDAPATTDAVEIADVMDNLHYTIFTVMDISDAAKADSLVRVVTAQTDPIKKKRAKTFAMKLFHELLDPRLLEYVKEGLDDATVVGDMVRESKEDRLIHHKVTARADSREIILLDLERTLGMTVDNTSFRVEDEAAGCAALKAWLTANWTQISAKCVEKKADPNRTVHKPTARSWGPRP